MLQENIKNEIFKLNREGKTTVEISKILQLEYETVKGLLRRNKIKGHSSRKTRVLFNKEEITFLTENYPKFGRKYCSEKLNRHKCAISKIAKRLGLKFIKSINTNIVPSMRKREITSVNTNITDITKYRCIIRTLYRAKKRAVNKNLEFNLDWEWVDKQNTEFCPVLGTKFIFFDKNRSNSISIDRINNSKGYTKENSIFISARANNIKRDATTEELVKIAEFYKQLEKKSPAI